MLKYAFINTDFEMAMKKTFKFTHDKIKPERMVEAIKYEVKKYIKRERNKKLTNESDFVDFDCKFGSDIESCSEIKLSEINKYIDEIVAEGVESFYIEVIAKPGYRNKS